MLPTYTDVVQGSSGETGEPGAKGTSVSARGINICVQVILLYLCEGTSRKPWHTWTTWSTWTTSKLYIPIVLSPLLWFIYFRGETASLVIKDPLVLMEFQDRMEMLAPLGLMDHQ